MEKAESYREEYLLKTPIYEGLGKNLCAALELILHENKIDFLKVYYRIKGLDSFIEKIDRKEYTTPFEQTEDICGIRIICYFQKDVEKIQELLNKELDVKESEDKEDLLEVNQFGYRSHHLIAKIPSEWYKTPNFRNLKGLKTEIQVRTVLMHAWAEIEHKLSYKKKSHIPNDFKRKLFMISAKLEESDEQFQELKEKSEKLQHDIIAKAKSNQFDFSNIESLDLDTFQAYLDFRFQNRIKNIEQTRSLLDELLNAKVTIKDIESGYFSLENFLKEIEVEVFEKAKAKGKWNQAGVVRNILDLTNEKYLKTRDHSFASQVKELKQKFNF
ncbi:MAG: GTP pyrophosphokinase family protein [Bacteroidia bacterium]